MFSCIDAKVSAFHHSGYNHPNMLKAFDDPRHMKMVVNRPALGVYPGNNWVQWLNAVLMDVAPQGLDQVSRATPML